jgi:hypothetical protein
MVHSCNVPSSSEDPLYHLAVIPIFLLDLPFSLFYTLPMKRKFLLKALHICCEQNHQSHRCHN